MLTRDLFNAAAAVGYLNRLSDLEKKLLAALFQQHGIQTDDLGKLLLIENGRNAYQVTIKDGCLCFGHESVLLSAPNFDQLFAEAAARIKVKLDAPSKTKTADGWHPQSRLAISRQHSSLPASPPKNSPTPQPIPTQ